MNSFLNNDQLTDCEHIERLIPVHWDNVVLFDHDTGDEVLTRTDAIDKILALCRKRGFQPTWLHADGDEPVNLHVREDRAQTEDSICLVSAVTLHSALAAQHGKMAVAGNRMLHTEASILVDEIIDGLGDEVHNYREITDPVYLNQLFGHLEGVGLEDYTQIWSAWENPKSDPTSYEGNRYDVVFVRIK